MELASYLTSSTPTTTGLILAHVVDGPYFGTGEALASPGNLSPAVNIAS